MLILKAMKETAIEVCKHDDHEAVEDNGDRGAQA